MKGLNELILGIKSGYSYFYCESQEVQKITKEISNGLKLILMSIKTGWNIG